jgi:hypothetical protein
MTLVFQYGSNCMDAEINSVQRLRGDAAFVEIAETVEDFVLAFDVQSKGRGCAAANIVRTPGSKVWGVLYEVPDYLIGRETAKARGRRSFDEIEGESKNYKRECIDVRCRNGKVVTALTYTVINPRAGLKTNLNYVQYIVCGLRERGIPAEYVAKVKMIAQANNLGIASELENL